MKACDYSLGARFKNVHTKQIWEVTLVNDELVFKELEWGDISSFLDEDNFISL